MWTCNYCMSANEDSRLECRNCYAAQARTKDKSVKYRGARYVFSPNETSVAISHAIRDSKNADIVEIFVSDDVARRIRISEFFAKSVFLDNNNPYSNAKLIGRYVSQECVLKVYNVSSLPEWTIAW